VSLVTCDKKGHPVTDLKASDFELFDNGCKLEIRCFVQARNAAASESIPGSSWATAKLISSIKNV
jgi:hypothetical protein